jgi:hypothetical protein
MAATTATLLQSRADGGAREEKRTSGFLSSLGRLYMVGRGGMGVGTTVAKVRVLLWGDNPLLVLII